MLFLTTVCRVASDVRLGERAGSGLELQVHLDCCAGAGLPRRVFIPAADLVALGSFDAAGAPMDAPLGDVVENIYGCLGLPPRDHPLQQRPATFTPAGRRLTSLSELKQASSVDGVFLLIEGGQYIRPGVAVGHRQRIELCPGESAELETVSLTPLVFSIENFLSAEECEHVISEAAAKMFNSPVAQMDADVGKASSNWRTSKQAWLNGRQTATITTLTERVAKLTCVPETFQEPLQVLQYGNGQKYDTHLDAFDPRFYQENKQMLRSTDEGYRNRMATAFWYMTDVEAGGETIFPRAGGLVHPNNNNVDDLQKQQVGLLCQPKQGKIILFYNLLPNGAIDQMSLHGGCPVLKGEKWAANKWIWNGNPM